METVILVLDESGSKGYDNNQEQTQGEFGVMAGFALPESKAPQFLSGLSAIVKPFQSEGKLHMTDLSPSKQKLLRKNLFQYGVSFGSTRRFTFRDFTKLMVKSSVLSKRRKRLDVQM